MQKEQITELGDGIFISKPTTQQRERLLNALKEPAPTQPETFTRNEVGEIFKIHPNSCKRWEKAGNLRPIRITPRTVRYDAADVRALLEGGA